MYSGETKDKVISEFIDGKNVSEIAKDNQISNPSIYGWLNSIGYTKESKKIIKPILKLYQNQDYSKALELCETNQFLNILFIKKIKLLITQKNEILENDDPAQISLKIKNLIKAKKFIEALTICNLAISQNSEKIQSQKVKILIKLKRFEEALAICNKDIFQEAETLQSQKIKILIKLKRFEEALAICNRAIFQNNEAIQSQKVTILIILRRFIEALAICNKAIFQNNETLQSQKVTILIKLKRFEEALAICNRAIFQNIETLQSQKVKILIILRRFTEALAICNKDIFQEAETLQSQKVKILIKSKRFIEALAICNKAIFQNNETLQSQKESILIKLKDSEKPLIICDQNIFQSKEDNEKPLINSADTLKTEDQEVSFLFTKLYANQINYLDIQNSSCSPFIKTVLRIAYYEKSSKMLGLKTIQKELTTASFSKEELQIIKKLLERLRNKKALIQYDVYALILNTSIDLKMYQSLVKQEQEEKRLLMDKPKIISIPKKEKIIKKDFKSCVHISSSISPLVPTKKKQIEKIPKKLKIFILKDLFPEEVLEIEKYLYVKANLDKQKGTLQALDNFYSLVHKPIDDKKSLEKLQHIIAIYFQSENSTLSKKN